MTDLSILDHAIQLRAGSVRVERNIGGSRFHDTVERDGRLNALVEVDSDSIPTLDTLINEGTS